MINPVIFLGGGVELGFEPRASCLQSGPSTTQATPPTPTQWFLKIRGLRPYFHQHTLSVIWQCCYRTLGLQLGVINMHNWIQSEDCTELLVW